MDSTLQSSAGLSVDNDRDQKVIRWRLLVLCVAVGLLIGNFLVGLTQLPKSDGGSGQSIVASGVSGQGREQQQPNESFSPEQVVEIQMLALSRSEKDRSAVGQVFAFASPSNRLVTGPISRFANMLSRQPFYAMVACEHWMSGTAVHQDGLAAVLVTTIDAKDRVSLYRFYLSRQSKEYAGCWMTDRVVCLFQSGRTVVSETI